MTQRFENKTVIVTGASGEIGQAIAQGFLSDGAKVVAADLDETALVETVNKFSAAGHSITGVTADVSSAEDVERCVDVALETYGRVDAMINNAGVEGVVAPVEDYPEAEFDKVIGVNVRGVFLGMRYAVPALRKSGGGSIVNLASVAGLSGSTGTPAYNASKHAVIGLTRSGAVQLGAENIRVNAVCPSPVTGRMMASLEAGMLPDDPASARELIAQQIPMQRYADPKEVADLVLYLCSDGASFLNGGIYTVDGGMTAGL
ncbi:MAG: SDR family oxidoreductase [Pseudomonadota bacterium]